MTMLTRSVAAAFMSVNFWPFIEPVTSSIIEISIEVSDLPPAESSGLRIFGAVRFQQRQALTLASARNGVSMRAFPLERNVVLLSAAANEMLSSSSARRPLVFSV